MGGSDRWFENYERLLDQRDAGELEGDETDVELAEQASEMERDQMADRADQINDERWLEKKADEVADEYDFSKGVRGKYVDKGEK